MKKSNQAKAGATRRDFIKTGAAAAAGFMVVPRNVLGGTGFVAPSDKLIVAGIGAGGKGESDIRSFHESGKAEIAYLCDVDDRRAAGSVKRFPKAKYYKDYREMLDKDHSHNDAVSISTPDHKHAIRTLAAMQLANTYTCRNRLHMMCLKPVR